MRTIAWTLFALVAFAANSVLCRIALREDVIDPSSFATIRMSSGAATLLLLSLRRGGSTAAGSSRKAQTAPWASALALSLYAVAFSFAYTRLSAGTGALILFGCVQSTMMLAALASGERPHPLQWVGLGLALAGLVYLVLPGLTAPSPAGAALMALAGISWGIYTLRGRGAASPLAQTTSNFVRSVPLVVAAGLFGLNHIHVEPRGALLAVASGSLASGLGYVAWYAALRELTATRAAVVQLAVPILAALGGGIFLAESVPVRLVLSSGLVLGGIALALAGRQHRVPPRQR